MGAQILARPAAPVTATVAKIVIDENSIQVNLPEIRDDFNKLVKSHGYSWDTYKRMWMRRITELSGPVGDRAAELCSVLLKAGFEISAPKEIVHKAASGDWQPEQKRWVREISGKFGLYWRGKDEGLFYQARMLPSSEYDGDTRSVLIPALYYGEVEGFAEVHGFRFTQTASVLLENSRQSYTRLIIPSVPTPEPAPITTRGKRRFRRCDPAKFIDIPDHSISTTTQLYPHQEPAVKKLAPLRIGALFMDMGTGKTRCAIDLVVRRQARISSVIWFCPVSLKLTIAAEIRKHTTGGKVYIFDEDTTSDTIPDAFWYIVGIESMSSSDRAVVAVNKLVDQDAFVIVDESSYIKGHSSKRTLRITEIGKKARYRLLLTGTPISQGVEDLYAQMRFLSQEILGYQSFYAFAANHLEYSDKFPGKIERAHNVDHLADKIAPFVYQITKEEALSLPDKLYNAIYCELTAEQWNAYAQAKEEILSLVEKEELPAWVIFHLFTTLQQIVCGYWKRGGEFLEFPHRRIHALQQAIVGIPDDCKVIIWCKHIYSLRQIADELPGSALYYGDLNEQEREAELQKFRGDVRFLIATQSCGGHGLTLNEAHFHIFYENEFKYSHRIQAEDRSHRIGQEHPVTYIDIVSESGIDRRIQQALSRKEDVLKSFRREVKKVKDVDL